MSDLNEILGGLISLRELSQQLHVTTRTISRLIHEKKLGCVKIGHSTYVPYSDIKYYIMSNYKPSVYHAPLNKSTVGEVAEEKKKPKGQTRTQA